MSRNLGLRTAENLHEIADTDLLISHEVQEAQPRFVAKCLKESLNIEGLFRHGFIYMP